MAAAAPQIEDAVSAKAHMDPHTQASTSAPRPSLFALHSAFVRRAYSGGQGAAAHKPCANFKAMSPVSPVGKSPRRWAEPSPESPVRVTVENPLIADGPVHLRSHRASVFFARSRMSAESIVGAAVRLFVCLLVCENQCCLVGLFPSEIARFALAVGVGHC